MNTKGLQDQIKKAERKEQINRTLPLMLILMFALAGTFLCVYNLDGQKGSIDPDPATINEEKDVRDHSVPQSKGDDQPTENVKVPSPNQVDLKLDEQFKTLDYPESNAPIRFFIKGYDEYYTYKLRINNGKVHGFINNEIVIEFRNEGEVKIELLKNVEGKDHITHTKVLNVERGIELEEDWNNLNVEPYRIIRG